MSSTTRRAMLAALAAAPVAAPFAARAQAWPQRDLRIVVPFPPGGTTDVVARLLADRMREQLGRAVIVENWPGAGGTVGAARFVRDGNDQHSLFLSQIASHGIAPAVHTTIQYRPVEDFLAVALVVTVPNVWVASARRDLPRDVRAFLKDARANPDRYSFASAGNGTSTHLTGELIKLQTGTRILHVPYRGAGPGMTAVIAGEVDTFIDNLPTALPQIRAGTVIPLAVTTRERVPELPDVPALAELGAEFGLEGFETVAWFGLHAHAGTPAAVAQAMNRAVNTALADEGLRRALAERGTVPRGGSAEEYAALMERELARWARVVREANVTVQ
jgi:tripartite-type tricarboxylate transporter receptor subunit TctC